MSNSWAENGSSPSTLETSGVASDIFASTMTKDFECLPIITRLQGGHQIVCSFPHGLRQAAKGEPEEEKKRGKARERRVHNQNDQVALEPFVVAPHQSNYVDSFAPAQSASRPARPGREIVPFSSPERL